MKRTNNGWLAAVAALAVLGCWHLGEVREGMLNCGDTWLSDNYLLLLAAALAGSGLCGWLFLRDARRGTWASGSGGSQGPSQNALAVRLARLGRRLKNHEWELTDLYPLTGIFLGMLYLMVLPPLSAPDEISHYISAYQLSSHMLGQPANSEDGHVLVRARDWVLEDVHADYAYEEENGYLIKKRQEGEDASVVLGSPLVEETYRILREMSQGRGRQALPGGEKADGEEMMAASAYPPVRTTPAAYIPQALGIALARVLGLDSLWLAYLGRFCNLLFFVAVTWLAMKRLPVGREVLFGVTLLPMTLHLSASFSYDAWIMAWIFYFTACCLHLAYKAERVKVQDVAALALIMALVGPCKIVYAVFMGLCLLIPVKKFGGWQKWFLSACCVLGAWMLVMFLVNGQTVSDYVTPETENYISWAEETGYSLGTLRDQPWRCLRLFVNTIAWQAEQYHLSMVGAYLGNLDPVLDVPYLLVVLFTACLLLLSLRKPGETLVLTGVKRLWIWFLCLSCIGAIMLSMLLAWTPIGSKVISGVQGRYFLPFLPVLLMALKNDALVLTRERNRKILYLMCCTDVYVALRLYSIVSMRL